MSDTSSLDTSTQQVTLTPASPTSNGDVRTRHHAPLVKRADSNAPRLQSSLSLQKTPPHQMVHDTPAKSGDEVGSTHDLERIVHHALNEGRLPDLTRKETGQLKKSTKRRLKKARIQLAARPVAPNTEQQAGTSTSPTVQSLGKLPKAQMKVVNKEANVIKRRKRLEQRAANRALKKANREAMQSTAQAENGDGFGESQRSPRQHDEPPQQTQTAQSAYAHPLPARPPNPSFSGQWAAPFPNTGLFNQATPPPVNPGFLPQWPPYAAPAGFQQGVLPPEQQQAAMMWSMWHAHQYALANAHISTNMQQPGPAMPSNHALGLPQATPFMSASHGYNTRNTPNQAASTSQNFQRSFHNQTPVTAPYPTNIRTVQSKPKPRDRMSRTLPVPVPGQEYLDIAWRDAKALDQPRPLLIILDLNGTLVHRRKAHNGDYSIQQRPHLAEFVEYLTSSFSVMLWSSAKIANVKRMADNIFTSEQRQKLIGEWGREHCNLTDEQYNSRVQIYKHLSWVWKADYLQARHPWAAQGYKWDATNTVLLDDSLEKARAEPFNLIEISEFNGQATEMDETILTQIMDYLEALKQSDNVAAYMRKTPFKYDVRWQQGSFHPVADSDSVEPPEKDEV